VGWGSAVTLPMQEISDRMEIEELLIRYCHTIDQRDWTPIGKRKRPEARSSWDRAQQMLALWNYVTLQQRTQQHETDLLTGRAQ
jgi:hypothetical protein